MNRWTELRSNLVAALEALPALAGIPVKPIAAPTDVWAAIPEGTGIGVARRKTRWVAGDEDMNYYLDQNAAVFFDVVVKTDSPQDNADGLIGEGGSEDLAFEVLRVRDANIGTVETGEIHVLATDESVVLSKNRAEGGAGPIAQVISFRTTSVPM